MSGSNVRPLLRAASVAVRLARLDGTVADPGSDATVAWIERDGTRWHGLDEAWRLEAASSAVALPDQARAWLREHVADRDARTFLRFFGGLAFDADHAGAFPAGALWLPACLVRQDATGADFAVTVRRQEDESDQALEARLDLAVARYRARLATPQPARTWEPGTLQADAGARQRWTLAIEDALAGFAAGRFEKVVLARTLTIDFARPPAVEQAFLALAERAPGTLRFLLRPAPDAVFFGASPELLVEQAGGHVHADCLAGTAPRGSDAAHDDALGAGLLASAKDRHEHAVVVDFVRQALAPHADALAVADEPVLSKLANVQHLYTPVDAVRPADAPLEDLVAALHPTPAVCGQPREAARAWIQAAEAAPRGWYAGAVGWVGLEGARFAVGIRSAAVQGRRALVYAGAGLVPGSTAEGEWAETERKAAPLVALLTGGAP
ncbi:MAG: uncharacterized protein JWM80_5557 [Cyanobacteria bacterium RYN_339]|nr:uncharacterized protein [Cyanobacteria bacterium RYN_339]